MRPGGRCRCVLVPILDGDVDPAAIGNVRALLAGDARVVLLHVGDRGPTERAVAGAAFRVARWRALAEHAPRGRVFVAAVAGNVAEAVLSQAERFGCDLIVLGEPLDSALVARLRRAARCPVLVPAPVRRTQRPTLTRPHAVRLARAARVERRELQSH
jgi:hypothetical protein